MGEMAGAVAIGRRREATSRGDDMAKKRREKTPGERKAERIHGVPSGGLRSAPKRRWTKKEDFRLCQILDEKAVGVGLPRTWGDVGRELNRSHEAITKRVGKLRRELLRRLSEPPRTYRNLCDQVLYKGGRTWTN